MPPPTSILLLGAGELGTQILNHLTTHPQRSEVQRIALLLRPSSITSNDPTKQASMKEYAKAHIDLIPGDLATESAAHLACLFAPFDTVVSCAGMTLPRGTQMKISRAVLEAGVKRYVPWQFGLDYDAIGRASAQDLFDEQLDVRDLLRGQAGATEWVVVSTGMFLSFCLSGRLGLWIWGCRVEGCGLWGVGRMSWL